MWRFSALVQAGCAPPAGITSIYLTSVKYESRTSSYLPEADDRNLTATFSAIVNGSSLEVRTGFWGICVRDGPGKWQCGNDISDFARMNQPLDDPLNLIALSAHFKDGIFFSGFL